MVASRQLTALDKPRATPRRAELSRHLFCFVVLFNGFLSKKGGSPERVANAAATAVAAEEDAAAAVAYVAALNNKTNEATSLNKSLERVGEETINKKANRQERGCFLLPAFFPEGEHKTQTSSYEGIKNRE